MSVQDLPGRNTPCEAPEIRPGWDVSQSSPFITIPMTHIRTMFSAPTTLGRGESIYLNLLIAVSILAGHVKSTSQEIQEPDASSYSEDVAQEEVLDWRYADPYRPPSIRSTELKFHKLIDWRSFARKERMQGDPTVQQHESINWQRQERPGDHGNKESRTKRDIRGKNNGPERVVKTERQSMGESDTYRNGDQISSQSNSNGTSPSLPRNAEEPKKTSNQTSADGQNQSSVRVMNEDDRRIDWRKQKKKQRSTPGTNTEDHLRPVAQEKRSTSRNKPASKFKTIYLDEIDWRQVTED